jgi:nicotinic acetylcholine receptor
MDTLIEAFFNNMKVHASFFQVDLKHMHQEPGNNVVEIGIDLTEFYLSVEWDILDVPATKNVENYNPEMDENERDEDDEAEDKLLTDITFILTMRRKTLFYTVNLIIPCVGISFLTVLVFYLPADSGEKVNIL